MARPTESQLEALARECSDVEELDTRVSGQFGIEHVPAARLVAVRLNGARWVFGRVSPPKSTEAKIMSALCEPQSAVLFAAVCLAVVVFLWPPYCIAVQGGTIVHTGFHSIFVQESAGTLGTVNVPLLALELVALAAVGGCCYVLVSRVEAAIKRRGSEL